MLDMLFVGSYICIIQIIGVANKGKIYSVGERRTENGERIVPGLVDKQLTIVMGRLIQRVIHLDRNEKACHGVTLSQHQALAAIHRGGQLTMNELSHEMQLAVSTVTRIVDILVRDGLVSRSPDESDRRKVVTELTDMGKEVTGSLNQCTEYFWQQIVASIPGEKKREIVENLKLLLNALEKTQGTCRKKMKDA